MMSKLEIKTNSLDELDEIVEKAKIEYQELSDSNPSITYTLIINESKMTVKIKVLDIGVQIN